MKFSHRSINIDGDIGVSSTGKCTEISLLSSQFHTQSRHVSSTIADCI